MSTDRHRLPVDGPAAPPRDNGELVFAEPWESHAFGLAFALADQGVFTWSEFQEALVQSIADWEADHPSEECWSYYRCWLHAVERLGGERGLVSPSDVEARAARLAARPEGHDHRHAHNH